MKLNRLQEHALALIERGFVIQPAHRPEHESGGKRPIATAWQNAEPMEPADALAAWAGDHPPNISILTGARGGVFVIDVDGERGNASMRELLKGRPPLPRTFMVKTASGGWHIYFRHPPQVHVPTNKSRLAPGLDLRGDGGQVIGPGSTARTKAGSLGTYEVAVEAPVANAPDWLLEACVATASVRSMAPEVAADNAIEFTSMSPDMQDAARAYVRSAVEGLQADLRATADWPIGHSDDWGRGWEKIQADAALRLASFAISSWAPIGMEEAREAFLAAAPTDDTWTSRDVEKKWASQVPRAIAIPMPATLGKRGSIFDPPDGEAPASRAEAAKQWRPQAWSDIGNGYRLLAYAGDYLRWVPELQKWARYERGTWHIERDAGERAAVELMPRLPKLEADLYDDSGDPSERKKFLAWARQQTSVTRVKAAAMALRYSGRLNASTRDFDTHPMLLNVANGVIDLTTGMLQGHDPALLFRQQSQASYHPDARAPRWQAFLERMMPDPEMRAYLQRIVGYTLTGRTDEQVFFMHHGVTKNGKSLFLMVIEAVLGAYSQTVPPHTLLTKRQEQHPADVARMEGKRMLQLSETTLGARLDEALVKRLSAGDTVTARGMGEEFREFKVIGKVHLVTNHLPHINHDDATMRRLRLVHWPVTIPEEERDPRLAQKIITTELSGVLTWAVQGCLDWQRVGLNPPRSAVDDTEAYIREEDTLGEFINDRLEKVEHGTVTNEHVWGTYKAWCELMNIKPMSQITLSKELRKRGFEAWRTNRSRGWHVKIRLPETPAITDTMFHKGA